MAWGRREEPRGGDTMESGGVRSRFASELLTAKPHVRGRSFWAIHSVLAERTTRLRSQGLAQTSSKRRTD